MSCREFQSSIDRYLDAELKDSDAKRDFKEHLSACPSCARLFESRKKLVASLRGMPGESLALPPMEVYLAQLRGRLAESGQRAWWQKWISWLSPTYAYMLAGSALATLVVVVVLHFGASQSFDLTMAKQDTIIEYLEVPAEEVSASTYSNEKTNSTVVWLSGVEVQATTDTLGGKAGSGI